MREATEHERQGVNEYIRSISQRVYTKNEVIAILKELQLEIEEQYSKCDLCEYIIDYDYDENDISEYRSVGDIKDITNIIQQKINALKENKND